MSSLKQKRTAQIHHRVTDHGGDGHGDGGKDDENWTLSESLLEQVLQFVDVETLVQHYLDINPTWRRVVQRVLVSRPKKQFESNQELRTAVDGYCGHRPRTLEEYEEVDDIWAYIAEPDFDEEDDGIAMDLANGDVDNVPDTTMRRRLIVQGTYGFKIGHWDVSQLSDFRLVFACIRHFNEPINEWNVSNATIMRGLFWNAKSFNQPLSRWDTSKVTDMSAIFLNAKEFNQPLDSWTTCNVKDMSRMFDGAYTFNQPLQNWDTTNAKSMVDMFSWASKFNQPLNHWNTSNVTDMSGMFNEATLFNQPLNNWDTHNVDNMSFMFSGATDFNQQLIGWDTSNVGDMFEIFVRCDHVQDMYRRDPELLTETWGWDFTEVLGYAQLTGQSLEEFLFEENDDDSSDSGSNRS